MGLADLLGFGKHTTTTTNMMSFLSSTTLKTIVKINNKCLANTTALQNQEIRVGTSDAVMLACLGKFSPTDCSMLMSKGVEAFDIKQDSDIQNIVSCKIDNKMLNDLQAQLKQQIDQKMNTSDDGVGAALKTLVSVFNDKKGNVTNNTSSQMLVDNTFDLESVQELISTISADQKQLISIGNANDSSAKAISQSIQIKAMADLLSSNDLTAQAVVAVDNKAVQDNDASGRGLTDIVKDVGDTVGEGIGSVTSLGKVLIIGGVACVCVIPIMIMALGKSGAIKAAENLGGKALDNMPQAQAGKIAQSLL